MTTSGIAVFGAPVELGSAQLADGTVAEFAWDGLEPGAEYLWCARAQRDASATGGPDPRYSDFRVFTEPAETEETPETSAPETPAPETPAEQPTATVTAIPTTSVSADPVTHTETEKVTETEPAVTRRETVTTSTTVATPTTVTSTAKEVSTAPNMTVEVLTTVPTTVEKQGDRVTETVAATSGGEEQFPDEGSSVTVGSSVTITPLGILLSLLGALGAVRLIAALLNYLSINLRE